MTGRAPGLVVVGERTRYQIEPIRHELGLTRVQMVDAHMRRLLAEKAPAHHPDFDKLLDARLRYAGQEAA